jgi:lipopolysaccharide biosynthesis glycosyltransferase
VGEGMSEKRLIFTIVAGEFHEYLGTLTHPQMEDYAMRVGADFKVVSVPVDRASSCCWEKYQIVKFLREYDRVLYLDTDVFIKDGAEDIFAVVPSDKFGAYNEIPNTKDFVNMIYSAFLHEIGVNSGSEKKYLLAPYFNAGVMLASRGHESAFLLPGHPSAFEHDWDYYGDQSIINFNVTKFGVPWFDISARFNLMMGNESVQMDESVPLRECSFFHFAGAFKQSLIKDKGMRSMAEKRILDLKAKIGGEHRK